MPMRSDLAMAWAIARKDALSELRGRQAAVSTLFFAGVVLLLFGFALGPDSRRLVEAAPGLLWLAIVFGGLLTVARLHQVETDPRWALVDASRHAYLVAVGTRGRGDTAALVLGSVSRYVVEHAHGPVMIARADAS